MTERPPRQSLEICARAVDQASFILKENPRLLFPQLHTRIQGQRGDAAVVRRLLEPWEGTFTRPWPRLVTPLPGGAEFARGLTGHTEEVVACACSPDSRVLYSADPREIRAWDLRKRIELATPFKSFVGIGGLAVHPRDGTLAVAGPDEGIALLDPASGARIGTLEAFSAPFQTCAFSRDGSQLAAAGRKRTVCVWNVESGQLLRRLTGHTEWILCCDFSPDGRRVISGSLGGEYGSSCGELRIWDLELGGDLQVLRSHRNKILGCAFGPDGELMATAAEDFTLRLWQLDDDGCYVPLRDSRTGPVHRLPNWAHDCAFSPDGRFLAAGCEDRALRLLDLRSGDLHELRGHTGPTHTCCFSPDGRFVASGSADRMVRIWDLTKILPGQATADSSPPRAQRHAYSVDFCRFLPDSQDSAPDTPYFLSGDGKTLIRWSGTSGECQRVTDLEALRLAVQPGGRLAYICGPNEIVAWDRDREEVRGKVAEFPNPGTRVEDMDLNLEAGLLAYCFFRSRLTVHLARASSGKVVKEVPVPDPGAPDDHVYVGTRGVTFTRFTPDGRLLITVLSRRGRPDLVHLWKPGRRKPRVALTDAEVRRIALSRDSRWLVTGGPGRIRVWDLKTGTEKTTIEDCGSVATLDMSPDGQRLMAGGGEDDPTIRVWDWPNGTELPRLPGHPGGVTICRFAPNGQWAISAGKDAALRVWDPARGRLLTEIVGFFDVATDLDVGPDSRRVAVGDIQGGIHLILLENLH